MQGTWGTNYEWIDPCTLLHDIGTVSLWGMRELFFMLGQESHCALAFTDLFVFPWKMALAVQLSCVYLKRCVWTLFACLQARRPWNMENVGLLTKSKCAVTTIQTQMAWDRLLLQEANSDGKEGSFCPWKDKKRKKIYIEVNIHKTKSVCKNVTKFPARYYKFTFTSVLIQIIVCPL